jgi:RHS repeat-associated protein
VFALQYSRGSQCEEPVRRRLNHHDTYDGLGRLKRVTEPGMDIHYVHDALGRRIGKVRDGNLEKGWLYADALNPIAELDQNGNIKATFIYGTRAHVPDAMVMADDTVYRFITDHVGSVRLVVNAETGAVVQRMHYDAFGRVLQDTNPGFQPFGFAGGLYDDDTGLVRFGARDYEAYSGRWTAKDPILFGGGQANLYEYCGNDPINCIDPSGLEWGFGVSVEFDVVAPFVSGGGGTVGLNLQYTSDEGTRLYSYEPGSQASGGLALGGAFQVNAAWGNGGGWTGNFYNLGLSAGPGALTYFRGDEVGDGPGWEGIAFGAGGGLPLGLAATHTNYREIANLNNWPWDLADWFRRLASPCP